MKPSNEKILEHSGILGMRWGIRRENPSGSASSGSGSDSVKDAATKAYSLVNKEYSKVYSAMSNDSKGFAADINGKFKKKYGKDFNLTKNDKPEITDEYHNAFAEAATKSLQKHSDKIIGPKVDPRVKVTWSVSDIFPDIYPEFDVVPVNKEIKHADKELDRISLKVVQDDRGFIIQLIVPTTSTGELSNEKILEHTGVLGMRWGIRKGSSSRSSGSEDHNKLKALKKKKGKDLTDAEIKSALARLRLEKEYKDLTKREISGFEKAAKSVIGDAAKETAKKYTSQAMTKAVESIIGSGIKK